VISFPYHINSLFFITEAECVYCAVRVELVNIIKLSVSSYRGKCAIFYSQFSILYFFVCFVSKISSYIVKITEWDKTQSTRKS